jgi:hypothetical protein
MLKYSIVGALVIALAAMAYIINACPCERIPGLWLNGEEVTSPVTDWSFANQAPLCQVEVRSWRPHSVNLNCMSTGPELFISCSYCAEKSWSNTAISHPVGKIRIGERLFPVRFERIVEPDRLDLAWQTRAMKLGLDATARPDHWWSFELVSVSN